MPSACRATEAVGSGELIGQDAPRVLQPSGLAGGALDLHPLLDIELVKRQRGHPGRGGCHPDVLGEFLNGREVGQARRVANQVQERDERVSLAAAVGQFQLPDRLVVLAAEPVDHILRQLAKVVRRVRQGEKLSRRAIDGCSSVHDDVIEVGGELGQ